MTKKVYCPVCAGTGKRPEFMHVMSGVCFHCKGTGAVSARRKPMRGPWVVLNPDGTPLQGINALNADDAKQIWANHPHNNGREIGGIIHRANLSK